MDAIKAEMPRFVEMSSAQSLAGYLYHSIKGDTYQARNKTYAILCKSLDSNLLYDVNIDWSKLSDFLCQLAQLPTPKQNESGSTKPYNFTGLDAERSRQFGAYINLGFNSPEDLLYYCQDKNRYDEISKQYPTMCLDPSQVYYQACGQPSAFPVDNFVMNDIRSYIFALSVINMSRAEAYTDLLCGSDPEIGIDYYKLKRLNMDPTLVAHTISVYCRSYGS